MSIDNGVYILKDKKGYRVCEAQCIENLWWWGDVSKPETLFRSDKMNPEAVEEYFGGSKYYQTMETAMERALELYDGTMESYGMCEYGIQDLGEIK